jgi:3-oxoacyl-[acyl-carrier protein] reductase
LSLKNRVALVTGAGKGIGKAIAILFAREGAFVACNDITEKCRDTAMEIKEYGGEALPLTFDVANWTQVNAGVKSLIRASGKVDVLVNNAGGSHGRALVHEMREDQWERTIAVNLKGCFNCSKSVLPSMIEKGYGKIVSISSIRAETGLDNDSAYAAAKAGIYGFSRSLAKEVAKHNINVNVISPGIIRTSDDAVLPWDEYMKMVPLGVGHPDDVAKVALFLSSEESRYITGQVLHVNGGWWPTGK